MFKLKHSKLLGIDYIDDGNIKDVVENDITYRRIANDLVLTTLQPVIESMINLRFAINGMNDVTLESNIPAKDYYYYKITTECSCRKIRDAKYMSDNNIGIWSIIDSDLKSLYEKYCKCNYSLEEVCDENFVNTVFDDEKFDLLTEGAKDDAMKHIPTCGGIMIAHLMKYKYVRPVVKTWVNTVINQYDMLCDIKNPDYWRTTLTDKKCVKKLHDKAVKTYIDDGNKGNVEGYYKNIAEAFDNLKRINDREFIEKWMIDNAADDDIAEYVITKWKEYDEE